MIAWNKCDRRSHATPAADPPALGRLRQITDAPLIQTSALTGEGMAALRQAMETLLAGERGATPEAATLTNLRQHTAVANALRALQTAAAAAGANIPHEMLLLDLYEALGELDTLTGTTTPDDILGVIFSTFCIGK